MDLALVNFRLITPLLQDKQMGPLIQSQSVNHSLQLQNHKPQLHNTYV